MYDAAVATGNEWLLLPKGFASWLRRPPLKLAVYVHDAMHDFYQRTYPGAAGRLEHAYFQRAWRASLRHARVIFTNTVFTAQEVRRIAAQFGLPQPQVVVVGIGFVRPVPAPIEARRGIVVLASPFPHKRTSLAAEWLARWQRSHQFDGVVDWVGRLPADLGLPDFLNWRHHERLAEPDFRHLLASARVLVFFSDYEGFGMPPLEAAVAGASPVFSDLSATREVMGETGFRFSNADYESFRAAMTAALQVPPARLESWAAELLARHDWEHVAHRIVAGLQAAD